MSDACSVAAYPSIAPYFVLEMPCLINSSRGVPGWGAREGGDLGDHCHGKIECACEEAIKMLMLHTLPPPWLPPLHDKSKG